MEKTRTPSSRTRDRRILNLVQEAAHPRLVSQPRRESAIRLSWHGRKHHGGSLGPMSRGCGLPASRPPWQARLGKQRPANRPATQSGTGTNLPGNGLHSTSPEAITEPAPGKLSFTDGQLLGTSRETQISSPTRQQSNKISCAASRCCIYPATKCALMPCKPQTIKT